MARFRLTPFRFGILLFVFILLVLAAGWWVWSPGLDLQDGSHDLGRNALWMQHGWFGDDAWFKANHREEKKGALRKQKNLIATARLLRQYHISDVFPHLCPADSDGRIPRVDDQQVERFLDAFEGFRVFPWVGGLRGDTALIEDQKWRHTFITSCNALLIRHPRLAGIHVNIEPVPSGDRDFLSLLEEFLVVIPREKMLSIAAYPPPTMWHRFPDVHWDEPYSRAVGERANQVVVMMYDTSLRSSKFYRKLMKDWTSEVLDWYPHNEVLLGIPAYDDADSGYHDPEVENISNALAGIHAALAARPPMNNYQGVAIYSEWEMTPAKWRDFQAGFLPPDDSPSSTTQSNDIPF